MSVSLGLKIKNNPGAADVCYMNFQKHPVSGSQTASNIPAASTGVCGTRFPDTNLDPLDVMAFTQGGRSTDVEIDVFWPDPVPRYIPEETTGGPVSLARSVPSAQLLRGSCLLRAGSIP
jgi:hypothetical protein